MSRIRLQFADLLGSHCQDFVKPLRTIRYSSIRHRAEMGSNGPVFRDAQDWLRQASKAKQLHDTHASLPKKHLGPLDQL